MTRAPIAGVALLFATIYFIQGVGDPGSGLIAQPVRSLLARWGESPAAIGALMALLALPWSLKPLLALLSDFVPLFGSRRRSYFIVSTAAAALGLGLVAFVPISAGERWLLIALLLVPTIGIAFTDVLADALMIEVGQPRGLTGRLQSVQWFAANLALLLSGVLGGWLTSADRHALAFLVCAALWTASLALAIAFVREPPRPPSASGVRSTASVLREAFAMPGLLTICAMSFVWDFNLLSYSVNYLHLTTTLGIPEQAFGNGYSLLSAGAIAATVTYGLYCRRLGARALLHCAVAAGVVANLLYWGVDDAASYYVAATLVGFAYMTGSLILLDAAARLVPLAVAATVFAAIMALANLGASAAEWLGGLLFEAALARFDARTAYGVLVAAGAAGIACAWFLVPRLARELEGSAASPAGADSAAASR